SIEVRISAIKLAGCWPLKQFAPQFIELLRPDAPIPLQRAVVAALTRSGDPGAAAILLDRARALSYTPAVRDAVIDAMLARTDYLPASLAAIEEGAIPAWAIDSARRDPLLKSGNEMISTAAAKVFTTQTSAQRQAVYNKYVAVLTQPGD